MRALWIALSGLSFLLGSWAIGADDRKPKHGFVVHVVNMPDTAFVNAFVVETSGHCVVIDAGFSPENGAAIRARAEATDKPIAFVLLTHAHIDHYGGVDALRPKGVPLVSSAGVARQVEEWDATNYARFGTTPPRGHRVPDRILGSGEALEIDGVTFTIHDSGPGESYADVWWGVSAGTHRAAILGDLVMFGIPPFLQSGHSGDWIRSLKRVRRDVPKDAVVYIGHDLGARSPDRAAHDASIIDWQIARLETFRDAVESRTERRRLLSPQEVEQVVAAMNDDAPENLPAFNFLVSSTANILAAELVSEREKELLEHQLQSVLGRSVE